jgi:hypothetical protein
MGVVLHANGSHHGDIRPLHRHRLLDIFSAICTLASIVKCWRVAFMAEVLVSRLQGEVIALFLTDCPGDHLKTASLSVFAIQVFD